MHKVMTMKGLVDFADVKAIRILRPTRAGGISLEVGKTYDVPKKVSQSDAFGLIKIGKAEASVEGVDELPGDAPANLSPEDRMEKIGDAILEMDIENADNVTQAGEPKVDVISGMVKFDITKAERDEAWEAFNNTKEPGDGSGSSEV